MKTIKTTLLVILTAAIWGLVPALALSMWEKPTSCTTDSDCYEKHGDPCEPGNFVKLTPDEQSSLWPYCPTGE